MWRHDAALACGGAADIHQETQERLRRIPHTTPRHFRRRLRNRLWRRTSCLARGPPPLALDFANRGSESPSENGACREVHYFSTDQKGCLSPSENASAWRAAGLAGHVLLTERDGEVGQTEGEQAGRRLRRRLDELWARPVVRAGSVLYYRGTLRSSLRMAGISGHIGSGFAGAWTNSCVGLADALANSGAVACGEAPSFANTLRSLSFPDEGAVPARAPTSSPGSAGRASSTLHSSGSTDTVHSSIRCERRFR